MEPIKYDGGKITRWDEQAIAGSDADGVGWMFDRSARFPLSVMVDTGKAPAFAPAAELAAWLGGQHTPPEPPIEPGDEVLWADAPLPYRVEHIARRQAWIDPVGRTGNSRLVAVADLRRVSS